MKNNTIIMLGSAAVIGYIFAPKELKDKFQSIMPGGGVGGGFSLGDIEIGGGGGVVPESWYQDLTAALTAPLSELPDNPLRIQMPDIGGFELPDWLKNAPDWLNNPPTIPSLPNIPILPNIIPDLMPGLIPDITLPSNQAVRDVLTSGGGIYLRQITGAALTGQHLLRPLPFARQVEAVTSGLRSGARVFAPEVAEKAAETLFTKAAKGGIKVVTQGADNLLVQTGSRWFGRGAGEVVKRIAPKAVLPAARIGARAIPVIGWGLLAVDVGADIVRIFGVNVPEWLGISGLISAFTGENPIEKWASQSEQTQVFTPQLALADPAGAIGRADVSTGQPEMPSMSEFDFARLATPVDLESGFKSWGTKDGATVISKRDPSTYDPRDWF